MRAVIPRRPSSVQSLVQCVCILPSCGRFFANLFLFVSAVPLRLRSPLTLLLLRLGRLCRAIDRGGDKTESCEIGRKALPLEITS